MITRYLLMGFALLALVSCGKKVPIKIIKEERSKWESMNTGNYEYTLGSSCKCLITNYTPALIVVMGDTIAEILDPSTGNPMIDPFDGSLVQDSLKQWFFTIDDLFEVGLDSKGAYSRVVEFNATNHYPTLISIDFIRRAYDDELYYTATDLKWR